MAHQPRHFVSLGFLFLFAMAASRAQPGAVAIAAAAAAAAAPCSNATTQSMTTFLRARCATTLYPDVCYDALLPYAPAFHTSHVKLAVAAADVAAEHLRAFSARINEMLVHRGGGSESEEEATAAGGGSRVGAALHDCASTISTAANLARRSSAELSRLDAATAASTEPSTSTATGGSSRQARWQVSNAKTWLSAAMANEGTCTDGFEDAGAAATASPAGKEVAGGVASMRQHTSNALALVDGIPL